MGTGYTRNDTADNIADGNIINASDLDGEFDALQSAFDNSTGHTHDGTEGEGAPIDKVGPAQDIVVTTTVLRPKTNNTVDLGVQTTNEFKDLWLDGTAYLDSVDIDGGTIDGLSVLTVDNLSLNGNTITSTDTDGNLNLRANGDGVVTIDSTDLTFGDNDKAIFGAGSDLQIYHDGSNSYIDEVGTGSLRIRGYNQVRITDTSDNIAAIFKGDAESTLYHNNVAKLATTSTGIEVNSTQAGAKILLESTDAGAADGPILDLYRNSASPAVGDDLGQLYFSGENSTGAKEQYGVIEAFIQDPTAGAEKGFVNYTYMSSGSKVSAIQTRGDTGGAAGEVVINQGSLDMDFRVESDSNANALKVLGSNGRVGIGTSSPSVELEVSSSATPEIKVTDSGNTIGSEYALFRMAASDGNVGYLGALNGDISLFSANELIFSANSGEAMRIDDSDNVGIGTSSPVSALHVDSTASFPITLSRNSGADTNTSIRWKQDTTSWYVGTNSANSFAFKYDNPDLTTGNQLVITSGGNVGIGISSPAYTLDFGTAASGHVIRVGDENQDAYMSFSNPRGFVGYSLGQNSMAIQGGVGKGIAFNVNNGTFGSGEAARIDSSGNLLVGTTSTSLYSGDEGEGFAYRAGNEFTVARASASPVTFVRQTNDGVIVNFKKDTANVGSIRSRSGLVSTIILDPRAGGNGIAGTSTGFYPTDQDGEIKDAGSDLGYSAARFKDLYLSGGVYLGGTDADHKLDDFETGSWTINLSDAASGGNLATYGSRFGYYTKVGNLVTVEGRMVDINTSGMTSGNILNIQGLPYSTHSTGSMACGTVRLDRFSFDANTTTVSVIVINNNDYAQLYQTRSGLTDAAIVVSAITSGNADLFFSITYRVSV